MHPPDPVAGGTRTWPPRRYPVPYARLRATLRRARPWADITRYYRNIRLGEMADLAEAIASAWYGRDLYASTSMHTLIVAQAPEFEAWRNVLRVDPVWSPGGRPMAGFRFEFAEDHPARPNWTREYAVGDGYAAFERFLRRAHWIVEYHAAR